MGRSKLWEYATRGSLLTRYEFTVNLFYIAAFQGAPGLVGDAKSINRDSIKTR